GNIGKSGRRRRFIIHPSAPSSCVPADGNIGNGWGRRIIKHSPSIRGCISADGNSGNGWGGRSINYSSASSAANCLLINGYITGTFRISTCNSKTVQQCGCYIACGDDHMVGVVGITANRSYISAEHTASRSVNTGIGQIVYTVVRVETAV